MKLHVAILLLGILLLHSSFIQEAETKGTFSANINGRSFQVGPDEPLKGIVVRRSGSMDGRTAGNTVVSLVVYGPSYDKSDGHPFNESVQVEWNYAADSLGEPSSFKLGLQFESTDYSMLKEQTKFRITRFNWEADHKHFRVAAEFDAKMRSWGYPNDGKSDVNLHGNMANIRVTVPGWLAVKN